ncbi:MAG: hypothetical protein R2688_09045 [Fimbriimonadaceae bacterium]
MVVGVTEGHKKELEIHGVGYCAQVQGKSSVLKHGATPTQLKSMLRTGRLILKSAKKSAVAGTITVSDRQSSC